MRSLAVVKAARFVSEHLSLLKADHSQTATTCLTMGGVPQARAPGKCVGFRFRNVLPLVEPYVGPPTCLPSPSPSTPDLKCTLAVPCTAMAQPEADFQTTAYYCERCQDSHFFKNRTTRDGQPMHHALMCIQLFRQVALVCSILGSVACVGRTAGVREAPGQTQTKNRHISQEPTTSPRELHKQQLRIA